MSEGLCTDAFNKPPSKLGGPEFDKPSGLTRGSQVSVSFARKKGRRGEICLTSLNAIKFQTQKEFRHSLHSLAFVFGPL